MKHRESRIALPLTTAAAGLFTLASCGFYDNESYQTSGEANFKKPGVASVGANKGGEIGRVIVRCGDGYVVGSDKLVVKLEADERRHDIMSYTVHQVCQESKTLTPDQWPEVELTVNRLLKSF